MRNSLGEMPILSGIVFCADCGKKLYQVRTSNLTADKEHMVCSTFRKVKGGCSSHLIRNVVLEQLLLIDLKKITPFAVEHEEEFVQLLSKHSEQTLNK